MTEEGALDAESVSDIALPDGVREALGRRLDRLSEEADQLLKTAAVVGREFDYETLALLGDQDDEQLLALIEEGLAAQVIEELDRPGRYRFTHALMQETLLAELATTRRVRLHGVVGPGAGASVRRPCGEACGHPRPPLWRVFTLNREHAERAFHYSRLAAEQATAQFASAEALRHLDYCAQLVSEGATGAPADEAGFVAEHARAMQRAGVDLQTTFARFDEALALFERDGDAISFATTTLDAFGPAWYVFPKDQRIAMGQRALAALGSLDPHLESRLLVVIAGYTADDPPGGEGDLAADRASAIAQERGFADIQAALTERRLLRRPVAAIGPLPARCWIESSLSTSSPASRCEPLTR